MRFRIFIPLIAAATSPSWAADGPDFRREVLPVLSAKCFHCHGPDEETREAGLRLDVREEAVKTRDGVTAIVPGKPDASDAIERIFSDDKDDVMPPPKEGHPLTKAEKELFKKWVAAGAPYAKHWAFEPPVRPAVPPGAGHPVDAFVSAELKKNGLSLSPEADRRTLLRRVTLDLTGLAPAPEDYAAFLADARPGAYERAVERLLASPRFGERWAKMWLDIARFADSTGYGSDAMRLNMWPWRDWVIAAFNRNQPYNEFVTEQLAGDLLPNATPEQIIATAFHRNTMTNTEGGTDDEEYRVNAVKDRVATTGQALMGLTYGCAQCHTHKFDPITKKEYYQTFAIFNQTEDADRANEEPKMPVPTAQDREKRAALEKKIADLEAAAQADTPELERERHEWESHIAQTDWRVLTPVAAAGKNGAQLAVQPDGSTLASGPVPGTDTYTLTLPGGLKKLTGLRVEALLENGKLGRADHGNAVLSDLTAQIVPKQGESPRGRFLRVTLPGADKYLMLAEVQVLGDGKNLALKRKVSQSSVEFGGDPKRANDGNTDGNYQAKSVSHTTREDDPWWEVDLGSVQPVGEVIAWARTDAHPGMTQNLRVELFSETREPVWQGTIPGEPQPSAKVALGGPRAVFFKNPTASFSQTGFGPEFALDADTSKTGWAFSPKQNEAAAGVFPLAQPLDVPADATLVVALRQSYGTQHTLARVRVSATSDAAPVEVPAEIRGIIKIEPSERSPAQRTQIAAYHRSLSNAGAAQQKQIAALKAELGKIKSVELPIMRELAGEKRRKSYSFGKGNYLLKEEEVQPGVLAAFHPAPAGEMNRLTFARWVFDPKNPFTARVAVNRFWAQLFGSGIVESEEDFGTQGTQPSHPELLDWLALEFSQPSAPGAKAWDVKRLLRGLVLSATYRQSSRATPELTAKDPRNRLLGHFPRRRLGAEEVRDQALQIAGLLSAKIGGPSVYPPQPDGLWKVAFNGDRGYATSTGEDRWRRGIYTVWRRTAPNPTMTTFDAPSRETCTLRRVPTNTPLQAFVTMNDPVFVEASQALARRILAIEGDTDARLRRALELTTGRPAEAQQMTTLRALFDDELTSYRQRPADAKALASSAALPFPEKADAAELAAWTVVANVLLNLDAALTKS